MSNAPRPPALSEEKYIFWMPSSSKNVTALSSLAGELMPLNAAI